jgi:hypothetical protein
MDKLDELCNIIIDHSKHYLKYIYNLRILRDSGIYYVMISKSLRNADFTYRIIDLGRYSKNMMKFVSLISGSFEIHMHAMKFISLQNFVAVLSPV